MTAGAGLLQALFAVVGDIDLETVLAEALGDDPGQRLVVFDQEDTHDV